MNKQNQALAMCKRAGKLKHGYDVVAESLQKNEAYLLVCACDISEKTLKELQFLSQKHNIELLKLNLSMNELWYLLGTAKKTGVLAVLDEGFAKSISAIMKLQAEASDADV